ncbi:MAG: hypothetical protein JXR45_06825, partial [Deltaproteobacteria bacterium]|nr:hypothetical protein [Deltaproteobacteria bacterium]
MSHWGAFHAMPDGRRGIRMITPQLNNRYGWYRIAWTALLVGMIPQFAIAGKLSDTSDVVGDDDDDD